MSDHVIKVMRDAAKTALNGLTFGATTTKAFVNRSDDEPLLDSELPAYKVKLRTGDDRVSSMGVGRVYERVAELVVEACQKKNATYEDDAIELQRMAEVALAAGLTGAKSVDIRRWEIEDDATGEKPRVKNTMTFEVLYYTANGAPQTAL